MEWIKVEDRLPKENDKGQSEDVIVYCVFEEMQVGFMYKGFWCDFNNERNLDVTHWQPLPKEPK